MVTHDRYLLESVANRMVEIEDGHCVVYDDSSYSDYLLARAERRARMEGTEARTLSLLAREAEWASRSPAARSTKQKGRLKRLEALRSQPKLSAVREFSFFALESRSRGGSTAIEMHGVSKAYGDRTLFRDVNMTIRPGDRMGIVGPNGAGKTTLLRMIRGLETADSGEVVRGSRIKIGVLDQARTGLEEDETLFEAVGGGNDRVVMGDNTLHVATFLERFLFPREMHQQKVSGMSGGERARLLLAKLMLQGANLLLLDEPTNDLDLLTLRVLEEALLEYDGTVVVVTHDRAFLDRVCTGVLGLDGFGDATVFADRQQFEAYQRAQQALRLPDTTAVEAVVETTETPSTLSYKERKELENLPEKIATIESGIAEIDAELADPATYHSGGDRAAELGVTQKEKQDALENLFDRWELLESRS
ncbi:MAG: ATP-binding cassette subfamily F protein uup [Myxococcota bacterium]|jgi:ATP-binding cassette subfamily F protein uup